LRVGNEANTRRHYCDGAGHEVKAHAAKKTGGVFAPPVRLQV